MSYRTWREYVTSHPPCNFRVTEYPLTAHFLHPGLNFSSFDRDHNIGILPLMHLVVDIRTLATYHPYNDKGDTFLNFLDATSDRYIFVSSSEFTISRAMYDSAVPKWPLEAKVFLGNLGNSSLSLPLELYMPGSREPLLLQRNQIVTVDKTTRRPKPFPEWFKDKFKGQGSADHGFKLKTFQRPEKTFVYKRQVLWMDTDQNDHTNYASYVRYAIDGLHSALKQQARKDKRAGKSLNTVSSDNAESADVSVTSTGVTSSLQSAISLPQGSSSESSAELTNSSCGALKGITEDILQAGMKNLKLCYVNESAEGDTLDVHIWQEEGEGFIVRSSIERGSVLICQIIMEYFTPLSKL